MATIKKATAKDHDCFADVNEQLKPHNAALDLRFSFQFSEKSASVAPPALAIALVKLDGKKRKSLPTIVASFCPFCGKSLD